MPPLASALPTAAHKRQPSANPSRCSMSLRSDARTLQSGQCKHPLPRKARYGQDVINQLAVSRARSRSMASRPTSSSRSRSRRISMRSRREGESVARHWQSRAEQLTPYTSTIDVPRAQRQSVEDQGLAGSARRALASSRRIRRRRRRAGPIFAAGPWPEGWRRCCEAIFVT